ncbi:hypothetical protein Tco_0346827, partial [Tanacetum coccineum]
DDPNITMEEYVELEAEKAHRHDFPAIIYEDALASDREISSKPTVILLLNNHMSSLRVLKQIITYIVNL